MIFSDFVWLVVVLKLFLQVIVFLGKLVIVPHTTPMCDRQNATEVEEFKQHTDKLNESPHKGDIKEKRGGINFITDWMRSKDEEEERRENWCHVVSVLDRYILIVLTVIIMVFGIGLSSGQPNTSSETSDHHGEGVDNH